MNIRMNNTIEDIHSMCSSIYEMVKKQSDQEYKKGVADGIAMVLGCIKGTFGDDEGKKIIDLLLTCIPFEEEK